MLKKITFCIFSLGLTYLSVKLVMILLSPIPADYDHQDVVINSFLINLYITGIFAFPGFVFTTNRLIGSNYFKLHNPKILTKVYNVLGVEVFRQILLIVYWGKQANRKKYFNGTRAGLKKFLHESKQSEFGHLGAFVLITMISAAVLLKRHALLSIVIMLFNIIGNFYPIILQRYHRIRIEKITKSNIM